MPTDSHASFRRIDASLSRKVKAIFQEAFGERGEGLCSGRSMAGASKALRHAMSVDYSAELADEVSFHLTDWGMEAAILVAIHLYPERFTVKELQVAVDSIVSHGPYHVAGAAEWMGWSVDSFLEDLKKDVARAKRQNAARKKRKEWPL